MKYLTLLVLCFTNICFSQIVNSTDNSPSYQLNNYSDMAFMSIRIVSGPEEALNGSSYLNEDFLPGTVLFHETKQKMLIPVRYNAATKEIEAKRDGNIVAIGPINNLEVIFDSKSFVSIKNPKNGKLIFVQRLTNGNYILYDFFEIKINKAPSDSALLNLEQKDELKIKSDLYFQIENGTIKSLPKRKKDLVNTFNSNALAFLKKQNLNLKKKEDAEKFFNFLNNNSEESK
ncbi:hypothetical protein MTsPCn9_20460 [Croceitalea sp. MTPC9]|uniref:hypothetical protein n=1 Tax=unclassified Croceitalea TaxID=2632280 RepID=UPI002B3AEAFC|nr:hypothetical protein MTsPCn6_25800 [Croceitalea sp. MTPC6]GMN17110.1 hypothetical protein MTsPCn9_20460 [Croceitalea sp. MTPC9]